MTGPDCRHSQTGKASSQLIVDGILNKKLCLFTSGYQEGAVTALPTDSSGNTYIPPIVRPVGKWDRQRIK